jgi:hypothetical protein
LALSAASVAFGCSEAGPVRPSYALQLHALSADVYGVAPECPNPSNPNNPYCMASRPSDAIIAATLFPSSNPQVVQSGVDTLTLYDGKFNLDSLAFTFVGTKQATFCVFLTLRVTYASDGIHGTWVEQQDCHGRSTRGVLIGTRE